MMRRVTACMLVCLLALTCTACGQKPQEDDGAYQLYFLTETGAIQGAALGSQDYDEALCTLSHQEGETRPSPACLLTALFAGPTQEGLSSPFPKGVSLKNWAWDGEQKGNLRVVLSEQYSGLTDISLTLADYCIVLTLSQLPGVESVEIQTSGHSANYRSHQILTVQEAVLDNRLLDK